MGDQCGLWQNYVWNPVLPFLSQVLLGKLSNLWVPSFLIIKWENWWVPYRFGHAKFELIVRYPGICGVGGSSILEVYIFKNLFLGDIWCHQRTWNQPGGQEDSVEKSKEPRIQSPGHTHIRWGREGKCKNRMIRNRWQRRERSMKKQRELF